MKIKPLKNKSIPAQAKIGRLLEKWIGIPFNILELIGYYLLAKPSRFILQFLEKLSYKLEGTLLHKILQYTLFPFFLVTTLVIGFRLAEDGFSIASLSILALVLIIYGLIFAPLERLMPFSRKWLDGGNDLSVDVLMVLVGVVTGVLFKLLLKLVLIIYLVEWLEPYGRDIWPAFLPGVVQVFLFITLKDFFRYWYHRWLHEIPFLWRWHAVHHSAERLYWLNGIRHHPIERLLEVLIWAIPLALIQPSEEIVMVSILMSLTIGRFQHSNLDLKLGFWEYIFSIGDNHRYHHHPTSEVGNSNYGGDVIIWDILFGTFHKPEGERPTDNIGIGSAPNYPQTMAGLMVAPFLRDQKVFGPKEEKTE